MSGKIPMSSLIPENWRSPSSSAWVTAFAGAAILGIITAGLYLLLAGRHDAPIEQSPILVNVGLGDEDLSGYCDSLVSGVNRYVGTGQREGLLQQLEDPAFESPGWLVDVHLALAHDYLRFGEAAQAVQLLEKGLDLASERSFQDRHRAQFLDALAVTYLKMGELDNCLSPTGALV